MAAILYLIGFLGATYATLFSAFFKTMIALARLALMGGLASGSAFLSYVFREMTLFRHLI
jgi:hypothetical protein